MCLQQWPAGAGEPATFSLRGGSRGDVVCTLLCVVTRRRKPAATRDRFVPSWRDSAPADDDGGGHGGVSRSALRWSRDDSERSGHGTSKDWETFGEMDAEVGCALRLRRTTSLWSCRWWPWCWCCHGVVCAGGRVPDWRQWVWWQPCCRQRPVPCALSLAGLVGCHDRTK